MATNRNLDAQLGIRSPVQEQMSWNPWAMPDEIFYNPSYDPKTMGMTEDTDSRLAGINLNTQGLDKFRHEATRSGPSQWAQLARGQQNLLSMDARERANREVGGRSAQARSALAMRGGLSSGARERVAKTGMRDYLDMSQGIGRQEQMNNAQIDMNDESNRIQQLGMLPGMELQALGPEMDKVKLWGQARQFDIGNSVKDNNARNDFAMDKYKSQMAGWAAGKQANATENAGKK